MSDNYWIWCNLPTSEEDMFIGDAQAEIMRQGLKFDNGVFISNVVPEISIQLGDEDEGVLTDHIVATGVYGLLMTHRLVQSIIGCGVENIQVFPVRLIDTNGVCISENYNIVNIIGCINAVDVELSDIEMHPVFPDEIDSIESLTLDESAIKGQLFFRLMGSTQVIVVHDSIKNEIEKNHLTGVKFLPPEDYDR